MVPVVILTENYVVRASNVSDFAWSGLRRYHNTQFVSERIIAKHKLAKRDHSNARKQAAQLRYCLLQAREYYTATLAVSLSTKPTLLYYCLMSLALAEILMKQDGRSSLDMARQQHRHHGLTFNCAGNDQDNSLKAAADRVSAAPMIRADSSRFGTFELWHRTAREAPLVGKLTELKAHGGSSIGPRIILSAVDKALPAVPARLSLLDCLVRIPGFADFLRLHGIAAHSIRASFESTVSRPSDMSTQYKLILHPGPRRAINTFLSNFRFDPNWVDSVDYLDLDFGGVATWRVNYNLHTRSDRNFHTPMPHACCWNTEEVLFWPEDQFLNEFGFHYAAMFIAGNYARYYPDKWMNDVEHGTPLAQAIEQLIELAIIRAPLATLSELSGVYHVLEKRS